jgi:hypothetical protein
MSDHPERPAADRHPGSIDSTRPEPPADEPAEAASRDRPGPSAAADETVPAAPSGDPVPPAATLPREPGYRGLALGLAAALLLVLALVGTAPLWAPLLPWGGGRSGTDPAIVERLDAQQQQIRRLEQQIAATAAAMPRLEQRIGAVEQRPAPASPDLGEMRQQIAAASAGMSDLATRLDRLESSARSQTAGISDLKTGLERLGGTQQAQAASLSDMAARLDRVEQAQQAQAADLAARLAPLQQGLQTQQAAAAELGSRMQALDKVARSRAGDRTDMGLALALLQIRNAVEAGRPFPAEYDALSSLARAQPEIAEAAAPLAAAAPTGTANRAELVQGLRVLAQQIDAVPAATGPDDGWTGAALDRLRGLIRIRRADEAEPARLAAATVRTAEQALAGGDLARAVTAIETLQAPAAAGAAEWLRRARERLAVEAALQRLEALLTGRLGDTAAMPGAPG